MPKLQQKTKVEVQRDIINALVARTGLVDVGTSATLAHLISAFATEISEVYFQFTRLADLFDFRRAAGADLDERAKEILGATIQRVGSRRAIGALRFERSALGPEVTIPIGTTAKNTDGVEVETIAVGTIAATSLFTAVNVEARALEVGVIGNIAATRGPTFNEVLAFGSKPAGVQTVFNPTNFVGGQEQESDDAFRTRIARVIQSLPRCTPEALAFILLGVEDPLGTGKIIQYSHVFEDPNIPGTAIIYVDDGNDSVVASATVGAVQGIGIAPSIDAPVLTQQTLTEATISGFTVDMIGQQILITDAAVADNNGIFLVTAVPAPTQITYTNTNAGAGVEPPGPANFCVGENLCRGLGGPPGDTAVGLEEFLFLDNQALVDSSLVLFSSDPLRGQLTLGDPPTGQYAQRLSNGLIKFNPPLQQGETIWAGYQYYTGLIGEAQRIVDGDTTDRLNYPGWRAAGIDVRVKPPLTRIIQVSAVLTVLEGFNRTTVTAAAEANVIQYINSLGISGDVIRNEIIERIMATPGVYNVALSLPTASITVLLDTQLPRTDSTNVAIT